MVLQCAPRVMNVLPEVPPPRRKSRWRVPAILLTVLCLPLLVLAIWFTSYRLSTASKIRKLENAARIKGERLTMKELATNYAAIPD